MMAFKSITRYILVLFASILMANNGYAQQTSQEMQLDRLTLKVENLEKELEDCKKNKKVNTLSNKKEKEAENAIVKQLDSCAVLNTSLRAKIDSIKLLMDNELKSKKEKLDNAAQYYPLVIKSIKIGLVNSTGTVTIEHGKTLYSVEATHLSPQIEYINLQPNKTTTLYVKLYMGERLRRIASSPPRYTMKLDVTLPESGTAELDVLGEEYRKAEFLFKTGIWRKGNYRYEIWHDDACLRAVYFTIH